MQLARHGVSTAQGGGSQKFADCCTAAGCKGSKRVDFLSPGGISPRVCAKGNRVLDIAQNWCDSSLLLVQVGTA